VGWHSTNALSSYLVGDALGQNSVLTEIFRAFSQSLQADAGMIPQLGHHCFFQNPFRFIIHLLSYHLTPSNLATDSK
jgi:hypothetical protein